MTIRSRPLVLASKFSLIVTMGLACLSLSGCGGDNPSQFAGSVEPKGKKAKGPDAKSAPEETTKPVPSP